MSRITKLEWQALSPYLDQLLELAPEARVPALERIRGEDAGLAARLRQLLGQQEHGGIIDRLATEIGLPDAARRSLQGMQFGAYTLVCPLGEGGMGSVWLAQRHDGRFEGQVAIKLLHLSMLASQGEDRFRREGSILARLSHPCIARLLDAGVGPSGQPYLVLEYVEGQHLDRYCAQRQLDIKTRLRLFLDVLNAVGYAHANLVLHRDLKPTNILVSADGQIKLLDFGVGRLLQDLEADQGATELTRLGGRAFTPEYAAPEQLNGQPVSTGTDIYSLGVMLYQLLTGALPWRAGAQAEGGRTLRTQRIVKPSLATNAGGSAGGRNALRGELDWICLKALAGEPARRYHSAAEFADDLQRHLAGQPVRAGPDSWHYVLRKFVGRNRLATGMAAGTLTVLIATLGFALWQAHAARLAAGAAELERQRATAVRDFLVRVFRASDPRVAQDQPRGQITAKQMLDQMTPRIGVEFAKDPVTKLELLGVATSIYRAFDDPERFHAVNREQVALARSLYGDAHPLVIDGLIDEVQQRIDAHDTRTARQMLARLDGDIHAAGLDRSTTRAHWWRARSDAYWTDVTAWPQVVEAARNAVSLYAQLAPRSTDYVGALNQLGNVYSTHMEDAAAAQVYAQAIGVSESLQEPDQGQLQTLYGNLAESRLYLGEFDAAESAYARVVELARRSTGEGHYRFWYPMASYARTLHLRGERKRAMAMFEQLLASIPHSLTDLQDEAAANVREIYAGCLVAEGRAEQAIPLLEELERRYLKNSPFEFDLRSMRNTLGDAYDHAGRATDARRALKASLDDWTAKGDQDYFPVLRIRERWGRFLLDHGEPAAAREQLQAVLAQAHGRTVVPVVLAQADSARLALAQGDVLAARRASDQALTDWKHVTGLRDLRVAPMLWLIQAEVLRAAHETREARQWAAKALAASRRYDAPEAASIREAQRLMVED
ncbi:MAG: serine/threonine protein kinase [Proteobacteria bacterium]|nr:serine/threonine protein kinase [Pseudomonadota bacterium]